MDRRTPHHCFVLTAVDATNVITVTMRCFTTLAVSVCCVCMCVVCVRVIGGDVLSTSNADLCRKLWLE